MDATRFDRIARLFAARRLSRRQALRQGGTGLAGALAAAGWGRAAAHAQEGTPPATAAAGDKVMYLFLQAFRSGSIAPKAGEAGTYTLTLEQGLGQTVYFSDRPERIVGASPTPQFLAGLGFADDNPPNAALVVERADGATEVAVVELFSPVYDEATHTATYDVTVLEEWERELGVGLHQTPADLAAFGDRFGAAHLFIDDCADETIDCCIPISGAITDCAPGSDFYVGSFGPVGFCWDYSAFCCYPCGNPTEAYWAAQCNQQFGECNGQCGAVSGACLAG